MKTTVKKAFVIGVCLLLLNVAARAGWVFSCGETNDLYRTVKAAGLETVRCVTPEEAITRARTGDGVLLLADSYPAKTTSVTDELYATAAAKKLRFFVEFPSRLPGHKLSAPKALRYERAVVASDFFGGDLPSMRILAVNGLHLVPVDGVASPHLVAARVAGFDTAVYGLPKERFPLLFEQPGGKVLVATTQFSRFVTARYAPRDAWRMFWKTVLGWLQPGADPVNLRWEPSVRPSYARDAALPPDAERQAVTCGTEWFFKSKLLLDKTRLGGNWKTLAPETGLMGKGGAIPTPSPEAPIGDGTLGILEAPLSIIRPDGGQIQSVVRRGDCTAESAMALAFGGQIMNDERQTAVAENLLDFYLFKSVACKRERGDPVHGAYGLIAWGIDSDAWYRANYGDDNARLMLGTIAVAALTGEARWDDAMTRCLLANLRTSGRFGFRGSRIDIPELTAQGWRPFFRRGIIDYSAHMESYLWACYLWAYDKTRFGLFYDRAETAIRMMMAQYADGWHWQNGLAQEKARMLLPLAWLVRVNDTPEHRAWLRRAVDGVVALQTPCGAIREEIGSIEKGVCPPPQSNADYGKHEAPLIQRNGDPVSDLLYTANFAFIGLHEAAAVGDAKAKVAEDKLADFLCRIQIRSDAHPSLDGGWFRAFDFRRWEAWGSNADAGWGAWAIESGWTQGWIVSTFALRLQKRSLWELTAQSAIKRNFDTIRRDMLPNDALQNQQPLRHLAFGCPVTLGTTYALQYTGGGDGALTDGFRGEATYRDPAWQGFHGTDLDAVVDLRQGISPLGVNVTFLQEVPVGIYLPTQVVFSVSQDGKSFKQVRTVSSLNDCNAGETRFIRTVTVRLDGVAPRYLRVQARNRGTIPQGHRAAGAPAWLFADEIAVRAVE